MNHGCTLFTLFPPSGLTGASCPEWYFVVKKMKRRLQTTERITDPDCNQADENMKKNVRGSFE